MQWLAAAAYPKPPGLTCTKSRLSARFQKLRVYGRTLAISRAPRIFRNPRTAIFQKADSATNACKRNIEMTPLHRDDTPPQDRGDTPPVQPGPSVDRRAARMKSKPCFFDIRLPLMLIPLKAHSYRL